MPKTERCVKEGETTVEVKKKNAYVKEGKIILNNKSTRVVMS
jgi:hypothetical protein